MANEKWTNNKGKQFVGQSGSVPAPYEKSPIIVDYEELNSIEVLVERLGALPTQAGNASIQPVSIKATIKSKFHNPVTGWEYDISLSSSANSDVLLSFSNIVPASGGITANVLFPVGILTGQNGIIQANSGGKTGRLNIIVA